MGRVLLEFRAAYIIDETTHRSGDLITLIRAEFAAADPEVLDRRIGIQRKLKFYIHPACSVLHLGSGRKGCHLRKYLDKGIYLAAGYPDAREQAEGCSGYYKGS